MSDDATANTDVKPMTILAAPVDMLESSIAEYKNQQEVANTQLAQLEQSYAQNKALAVQAIQMLQGAIVALEQVVDNVKKAAAEKSA